MTDFFPLCVELSVCTHVQYYWKSGLLLLHPLEAFFISFDLNLNHGLYKSTSCVKDQCRKNEI